MKTALSLLLGLVIVLGISFLVYLFILYKVNLPASFSEITSGFGTSNSKIKVINNSLAFAVTAHKPSVFATQIPPGYEHLVVEMTDEEWGTFKITENGTVVASLWADRDKNKKTIHTKVKVYLPAGVKKENTYYEQLISYLVLWSLVAAGDRHRNKDTPALEQEITGYLRDFARDNKNYPFVLKPIK